MVGIPLWNRVCKY